MNKVKTLFIQNMSHEIRTPLNALLGFTDLIRQAVENKITPEEESFFDTIHFSSERILRTIDSIINYSECVAGTYQPKCERFDLNMVLSTQVEFFRKLALDKGLVLDFIAVEAELPVYGDRDAINISIIHILDNAVKFTPAGRVTVKASDIDGMIEVKVQDTGIGMSSDYLKRIFEPYRQESEGFSKKYQGVGIGLALTRKYLEMNVVEIKVESKKDKGSTFTLRFRKYGSSAEAEE